MNKISSYNLFSYLNIFQTFLGGKMYLIFFFTFLSGLMDGFGILMLMPIIENFEIINNNSNDGILNNILNFLLKLLNMEVTITNVLIIFVIIFVFKGIFSFIFLTYSAYLRSHLLERLKGRLFDSYSRMSYQYYTNKDTGHFVNVLNGQIEGVLYGFHDFIRFCTSLISTIIYLSFAFLLVWKFGVLVTVIGGLIFFSFRFLNKNVQKFSRIRAHEFGVLNQLLIQVLHAFKYLTATGQTPRLRVNVLSSISKLVKFQFRTDVAAGFTQSIQEPVAISIMAFLLIVQVTIFNQPIAPVLVAIMMFYRALGSAFSMQISLQNTFAYSGNFEMVYNEFISQDNFKSNEGTVKIGPFNYGIYFENVSFYFEDIINPTLKNLNFFITAKKSIAFVGQSGSGKSTLIDLITFLLEPHSGSIKIDEVPSSDIELSSWRSQIGFVSQETVVFDDSLANNICLWDGDPNNDIEVMNRVIASAKKAHIADYIETLEEGYNTQVGDRGVKLSGGQKQRLFIARELFRNPNVLILDEATSSLDSESELIVQRSIDNLKGSTTIIIIAHRLSTIKNVDCIFVLDNGVIVESGSYEDLSNLENSVFKGLVNAQSL